MAQQTPRRGFWRDALAIAGSVTPRVARRVIFFAVYALAVTFVVDAVPRLGLAVGPVEVAGAILGLLLVMRTTAGYDRWWEARKLWGGIVNQSRNLAISALAYGPVEPAWRQRFVAWVAAFPHVARSSLRGERDVPEIVPLLGAHDAHAVTSADHMPGYVALSLGEQLRDAVDRDALDRFAFLQIDRERALLIDHIGACERILKTPLPHVYAIKVRRFVVLFLAILPFALAPRAGFAAPVITMFVAYAILALDQIGVELQNPFATRNLSHLPLDEIAATITRNVHGFLAVATSRGGAGERAAALESRPSRASVERATLS